MIKKRVAIFDIDGTIFRSSLLIELTESLIERGLFPKSAKQKYVNAYNNWLDRKSSYKIYIDKVVESFRKYIRGVQYGTFCKVAKTVVSFHKNRVYRYTRDLIRKLKAKNYFLLAISNSPKIVVEEFCKKFGFNKIYGRMYEIDAEKCFTGNVMHEELISDKALIVLRAIGKEGYTLSQSIGVGDTESDIKFLSMVSKPICFNPNKKLFAYAQKNHWRIVVERKDVIYNI